jgi:hypothetical protein
LVVLAAVAALLMAVSIIGFLSLFRSHEETPDTTEVAAARLSDIWLGPGRLNVSAVRVLHHRKETIWDGSTHEEWLAFVPGSLDLNQRISAFREMNNARNVWPLPEATIAAGHAPKPTVIYSGSGGRPGIDSQPPTRTEVLMPWLFIASAG